MSYIYGAVGYTVLKKNNIPIMIFADLHDNRNDCGSDKNQINIANWVKSKFNSSIILLEEVVRNDDIELKELWETSNHTQLLKNLYLNNKNKIIPVDIRPLLIPFSLELEINNNFVMYNYCKNLNIFFCLKLNKIINKEYIYNNIQLGNHFMLLKLKFKSFILKNKKKLFNKIKIDSNYIDLINDLLNDVMEFYICYNIIINEKKLKPVIIHAGLYHSEKVIKLLINNYNYEYIKTQDNGINTIKQYEENILINDACIYINHEIIKLFNKNYNIVDNIKSRIV